MGHILIKPASDRDGYIYWSTVVEAPIAYGTRDEIRKELDREWDREHHLVPQAGLSAPAARLERADRTGTSSFHGDGGWDDEAFIYEQRGLLPRRDLYRACELLDAGRESEVWDLLSPFEDADEVRRG